jgi:hypothetical protein
VFDFRGCCGREGVDVVVTACLLEAGAGLPLPLGPTTSPMCHTAIPSCISSLSFLDEVFDALSCSSSHESKVEETGLPCVDMPRARKIAKFSILLLAILEHPLFYFTIFVMLLAANCRRRRATVSIVLDRAAKRDVDHKNAQKATANVDFKKQRSKRYMVDEVLLTRLTKVGNRKEV